MTTPGPNNDQSFGTYVLSYRPEGYPALSTDSEITMKISAEASLNEMLEFFKYFLMASGYMVDAEDDLKLVKSPTVPLDQWAVIPTVSHTTATDTIRFTTMADGNP